VREWRQLSWPGTSSSGEGPFTGSLLVPALGDTEQSGPTHAVLSLTAVVSRSELDPVRLPQPQPRLASRARRRSPDSATYQRETRAHQRTTIPHTKKRFRSLRCSPDRSRPSCEQHGAGTSSFRKKPRLVPRRYLPYRPRCSELAVRAATQRPTRPHPEHPVVVDSPPAEPEETRAVDWSTEASTLTARTNGFGGPESRGAFESLESPDRGATPSSRDAPFSEEKAPTEVGSLGSPSRLFHRPPRPTLTGQPGTRGGGVYPPRGLRPTRQTVRHGASEIRYEPVARWQMCRARVR
jgi:hypothetical protein